MTKPYEANMMSKVHDITGQVFGRLTVVQRAESTVVGVTRWRCVCVCGGEKTVAAGELKRGNTASCGCLANEQRRKNAAARSHDTSKSKHPRAKHAWENMISRCYNPADRMFKNYGPRGITVCDEWRNSFAQFLTDMGDPPVGMTLDRTDNNAGYSPENCRWVDYTVQANNRSNNRRITIDGITKTVAQWAKHVGIKAYVIRQRLHSGWGEHDAVTMPLGVRR